MRTGIIYKAISPSGKIYIGQTTKGLYRRKIEHKSKAFNKKASSYYAPFSNAIRHHGFESFLWEILYIDIPESQLDNTEIFIIGLYNSYYKGYNGTFGGNTNRGTKWTQEAKDRSSVAHTGIKQSEETTKKKSIIAIKNNLFSGENNIHAKLTWEKVREIREFYKNSNYTQVEVAKNFNISKSLLNHIVNNKIWKE